MIRWALKPSMHRHVFHVLFFIYLPMLPSVWWTGMHAPQCVDVTLHSSPFHYMTLFVCLLFHGYRLRLLPWYRRFQWPASNTQFLPGNSVQYESHPCTIWVGMLLGARPIKKNTNSTQNKSQTQRAKQYEVTSFLSTDCELSTETCSKNVYSIGPWCSSFADPVPLNILLVHTWW